MQTADVNGHPLQDESGAFSDGLIPPLGELIEKFLMTVNGTRRTGGPEILLEKNGGDSTGYFNAAEIWAGGEWWNRYFGEGCP